MSANRYTNRRVAVNDRQEYRQQFKDRGLRFIRQYSTPILKHPTADDMQEIEEVGKIWATGDRFWKLAATYYGDPELWYIIAWWNQMPLEADLALGDTVYIPMPLERVLRILEL
jgi:hypothetical protein